MEFEVKPIVYKIEEDSVIIENEKVILSLKAKTHGVPIILDSRERGIVFFGEGDYLINSRIRTYVGIYSKQYSDAFNGWGIIMGGINEWNNACRSFSKTEEIPEAFGKREDFVKRAEEELHRIIQQNEMRSTGSAYLLFHVKGEKDAASLHYRRGRIVFNGCNAKLFSSSEEHVMLKEDDADIVLQRGHTILKSREGKIVSSGDKIVSDMGVISGNKIVTKGFVGKQTELVENIKAEAMHLVPKVLERLGYRLEK